jgi:hypothetical protein
MRKSAFEREGVLVTVRSEGRARALVIFVSISAAPVLSMQAEPTRVPGGR